MNFLLHLTERSCTLRCAFVFPWVLGEFGACGLLYLHIILGSSLFCFFVHKKLLFLCRISLALYYPCFITHECSLPLGHVHSIPHSNLYCIQKTILWTVEAVVLD